VDNCIFCRIAKGEIPGQFVYQDEEVMVIKDIHPQAPIHLLVIPKAHISEFIEADTSVVSRLMSVVQTMIQKEKISSYRLVNNGKGAAVVDHLHWHILGKVDQTRSL
jgi:histidine triad (HIT) family protein